MDAGLQQNDFSKKIPTLKMIDLNFFPQLQIQ